MSFRSLGPGSWFLVSFAVLAGSASSCTRDSSSKPRAPGKPPVPVTVAAAEQSDVPVLLQGLGTVEPVQSAPVKAQVGGILTEVRFREGDRIQAGSILFRIDPRPLEATLKQLEANLARDEAQARNLEAQVRTAEAQLRSAEARAANAESEARRYEDLVQKDYVTRLQYEQLRTNAEAARASADAGRAALEAARAGLEASRAAAEASRAAVENARVQLGYAVIRSPVSGQAGSLLGKQGDLVKANDAALVVINQIQPILVRFAVPEPNLPDVQKYRRQGDLRARVVPPGQDKPIEGKVIFVDNAVDRETGTIALKAQFENAGAALWPGQFVNVSLTLHTLHRAVTVPPQALQTGQRGAYVFVVDAAGTAAVRPVTPGIFAGGRIVIEKGLQAGETVVTDGHLRLTSGAKVVVKGGKG